ncbi:MAG: acyl--CoA ligase [Candidatus Aminicenantes bacterium]|nr:acyl--CoA ligase [Candidatus Aminicenantes bacterium]
MAFIGAEPYLEEISKVLAGREAPSLRLVIGATERRGFAPLDSLFFGPAGFATYPADDNDTSNILYTSGTTGASKGVMLTHKNLARNAKIISEMRGAIEPDTVIIGVLPLYHIYGITSVLNSAMWLGTLLKD